ncbi:hypothetical protein [Acidithiobacillus thiooxidans]|uniref:hypothetical protein n=1 Tax=Acidithiobacillus thiooxidans TaxID=930 RepID=UPI0004E1F5F8|nr:hypothetical protein [Acidithiobacillus thiooxidans]
MITIKTPPADQQRPAATKGKEDFITLALDAVDRRVVEMIDAESKSIHPAYRQVAHTAIRLFSREQEHNLLSCGTDALNADMKRFSGLTLIDDAQADTVEKALQIALKAYRLRRREVARVRKGLAPKLVSENHVPVVNKRRKLKTPTLSRVF